MKLRTRRRLYLREAFVMFIFARLAVRLLSSLEGAAESPEEIEKLWIAEAERRFQELRDGVVQGVPAQEVFAELRNKRS